MAYFEDRDLDSGERCMTGDIVDSLVDRGRWTEAAREAQIVVDRGTVHGRAQSLATLGRIAARRGDTAEAWRWLDAALAVQEEFGGEVAYPLRPARAEAAWLAGDLRTAAQEIEAGMPAISATTNSVAAGRVRLLGSPGRRRVGMPEAPGGAVRVLPRRLPGEGGPSLG